LAHHELWLTRRRQAVLLARLGDRSGRRLVVSAGNQVEPVDVDRDLLADRSEKSRYDHDS
jgi:hypothetical protein